MKPWEVAAAYAAVIFAFYAYLKRRQRRQDREWAAQAAVRIREAEDFAAWEREIAISRSNGAEQ